jgi:predicted house-cleaning NTP pyrophosphatase (Maf/HAM1 superfamily)
MEMDLRGGGFVPIGAKEKADDVPARLSKNEFVFTADAVRAAGGGSVNKGAQKMYDLMNSLEAKV